MARRIAFVIAIAAAVALALTHAGDIAAFVTTAKGGSAWLLALAAVLQVGYYTGYILTYRQGFASAGVRRTLRDLTPVMLASVFVNTVTPSAGTAGPALLVDDATRKGNSAGASTAGVLVAEFADLAGFAVVMATGFVYLAAVGRLTVLEVLAAAVFLALVAAMGAALVLGLRNPRALARVLVVIDRAVARLATLVRVQPPSPWAERVAAEFSGAMRLASTRRATVLSAWLVAVAGHTLDLACFVAIGWAFGWRETGPLVAGYAVGVVVWLTSIVPQGVGLVEGSVAVLLASFGAPPATAAAISLTFRGLTFWLPFLAGFALLPRVSTFQPDSSQAAGEFPARMAAVFVFAVAIVNILSASTPAIAWRVRMLEPYLPFEVTAGNLTAVLAGIALLMLSRGLWRHKRAAYTATLAILAVSAVSHMVKGLDYEEAVVALAALVLLLAERATFYARSDAPSLRQGLRVLAGAFAITLAYGTAGFWLLDRHFSVNFALWPAIRQTVVMFTQFYDPGLVPITGFGHYFAGSIYVVGAVTFGFALLMLLRPVIVRHPASAAEHRRAAAIVERYGHTSLSAMALLPDKSYWFSEGGSLVAYSVSGGMAVVLGDPIGPAEDRSACVRAFAAYAGRNGWRPVYYETDEGTDPAYRALGYASVCIGHEAIVRLDTFSLSGRSHKNIRNRINRLTEEGLTTEVLRAPQSARTLRALRDVSDSWLAMVKGSEKRFSMGWFDDAYIGRCDVMVVRSRHGRIVAFANIVSEYQAPEATIDLMRYRPESPAGVMDLLFVRLFEWARENGLSAFNLGLSPLAKLAEGPEAGVTEKVLRLVYEHGNAFYGFRGLHEYKQKFGPDWQPRYLVYPDPGALPAALAAATRLNSGENPVAGYIATALRLPRRKQGAAASA